MPNKNIKIMESKVALTSKMIQEAPDFKALFDLVPLRDNWINTYNKVSGNQMGEMKFEAEKVLALQAILASKQLQACDKFSMYSAITELAISGLTLRDGISYLVPYGKKATFMVGWRGRLEQINEIPTVVHCHEPMVVYDCDDFSYSLGIKTVIEKHKRGERTKDSKITHVYFVIEFRHGSEVYIMEAIDVLHIRDTYSSSYKQYIKECQANGKQPGEVFKVTKQGYNGPYEVEVEVPMWVDDEAQAFKKTIVKRVYGTLPKLPKQKWLDEKQKTVEALIDPDEKDTYKAPLEPVKPLQQPADFEKLLIDGPKEGEQTEQQQNNNAGVGGASDGKIINIDPKPTDATKQPSNNDLAAGVEAGLNIIKSTEPEPVDPSESW